MAAVIDGDRPTQVALVSRQDAARAQLRSALGDFGADVVAEQAVDSLDVAALRGSGATVVIVSLDTDNDAEFDALQPLLDDPDVSVVFDEASVSGQLSGWDLARWARHLAAKVLGHEDADPPRPADAEALGGSDSMMPVPGAPPTPEQLAGERMIEEFTIEADELADAVPTDYMPMEEPDNSAPDHSNDALGLDLASVESAMSADDARAEVAPTAVPDATPEDPAFELPEADFSALDFDADASVASNGSDAAADVESTAGSSTLADLDFDSDESVNFASFDGDTDAGEFNLGDDEDVARLAAQLDEQADAATESTVEDLNFADDRLLDEDDGTEVIELSESPTDAAVEDPAPADPEAKAERSFDFGSLSLEPMNDEEGGSTADAAIAGAAPEPAPSPDTEVPASTRAVFNLEPMDDEGADESGQTAPSELAPASVAAPETEAANTEPGPITGRAVFNLEPMDGEGDADTGAGAGETAAVTVAAVPAEITAAAPEGISRVIVLGASIGGPDALRSFLGGIPKDFPALFVLAQHLESGFFGRLAEQLQKASALPVAVVDTASSAANGQVLVVSAEQRMRLSLDGSIALVPHVEPPRYQPSIDNVLRDVADTFGKAATAIIFSGMAGDAIEGSVYLTSKGGEVWAQDSESCVVSSMVDGARARGVVEFTGSPRELAAHCVEKYGA